MTLKEMKNVCVPMITPFTSTGEVDKASLASLTEYLIEEGCGALYPCGTTGEMANLTPAEREETVKTVVDAARGRIPVFAQIGGLPTALSVSLAKAALRDGADGLGALTPIYYPLTDGELLDYYKAVSKSVPEDFPIYLYGIPGLAVNRLSPALVREIAAQCPNVRGIKYSVSDILTLMEFQKAREGFQVLVAPMQMLLPALSVGVEGIVSGNCNVFPREIGRLFALYREGKTEECRALQEKLAALAALLSEKEAAKCKALLKRRGVIADDAMRAPQQGLTEAEKEVFFPRVDRVLAEIPQG